MTYRIQYDISVVVVVVVVQNTCYSAPSEE